MRYRLVGVAGVGLALAGCVNTTVRAPPPAACVAPANAVIDAQLLFGLSMPGGGTVSTAAFDAFVAGDLTRQFPDGLTVVPGFGQWRTPEGTLVAEGSRVVMVVAPDTPETAARLDAVRREYRAQFHQRAVGLITVQSCASF